MTIADIRPKEDMPALMQNLMFSAARHTGFRPVAASLQRRLGDLGRNPFAFPDIQ